MKKLLLCSVVLIVLSMVIACKPNKNSEDSKSEENESENVQAETDIEDIENNTDETENNSNDEETDNEVPDDEDAEEGHPPNSYKDVDYDVKSIHD